MIGTVSESLWEVAYLKKAGNCLVAICGKQFRAFALSESNEDEIQKLDSTRCPCLLGGKHKDKTSHLPPLL
jgi:hypothetical protein